MNELIAKEKALIKLKNEFGLTLPHKISATLWHFPDSPKPNPQMSWQLAVFVAPHSCKSVDCASFKEALALLKKRLEEDKATNVHN